MAGNYSITLSCTQCHRLFRRTPKLAQKYTMPFCSNDCRFAHRDDVPARFWEKVLIGGFRECWPWQGSLNNKGYGQVRIQRKCLLAHRVAFGFMWFPLSSDRLALHRCDNPPCCNPWHLFDGTYTDNMRDMLSKGRRTYKCVVYGEQHPAAKLSNDDVFSIKTLYAHGEKTRQQLADLFCVSYAHIDHIVKGRLRKHG